MSTLFDEALNSNLLEITSNIYDYSIKMLPPDDLIVCRHLDGSIASYYGDKSWNRTPYSPDGKSSWLHFPFWKDANLTPQRDSLSREARWLMFLLIFKRNGTPLSFISLRIYLSLIRDIAFFGEYNNYQLKDILSNDKNITKFINCNLFFRPHSIAILKSLISTLYDLGTNQTGIQITGRKILHELNKQSQEYKKSIKQHPPIPTRIYSSIIATIQLELYEFEVVADQFLAFVAECASDVLMGRDHKSQQNISKRLNIQKEGPRPSFKMLLIKYDLENYFVAKDIEYKVTSLTSHLAYIQMTCKLMIQIYSGMRDDEITTLPYDCLELITKSCKTNYIILGKTTKLNHGLIFRTKWVTSKEGHKAIVIAKIIADTIYGTMNETPKKEFGRINRFPLFVSSAFLPFTGVRASIYMGKYRHGSLKLILFKKLKKKILPIITDDDIRELENIDPHRAWRSEAKFQTGQAWVLTSHQFRRSLALYAQRSGLVSLPSLRRQLKHITDEMSRFYARGSAFARDFIGECNDHFGKEWQDTGPISASLSYVLNVLLSGDVLFGGHANWINNKLRGPDGIVTVDREATLRRFKRGEITYRETFLGGCTNLTECKQTPLRWLDVECLSSCTNLVGKLSNLERIIAAQTRFVEALDSASIEFRAEKADLDVLIATRDNVLFQKNKSLEGVCQKML